MNRILLILISLQIALGQKIFESFDLNGMHKYSGTTSYEFDVNISSTPSFNIHEVKGDIRIKGIPGMTVYIEETVSIRNKSKRVAENHFEDYRASVSHHLEGNIVEVLGKGHWPTQMNFTYKIQVPSASSIMAYTSGGDIELSFITGEIDLKTSGGDLTLEYLTGKLSGKTSGGDIQLDHGTGSVYLSTSGGDVEISNVEGKVNAYTSGGDIDVDNTQGNVVVHTSGGSVKLQSIQGNRVEGRTSGGDIEVEDITGELIIQTSGGDLDLEDVRGSIKGSTSGGDIELYDISGPVDVSTSGGSIQGEDLTGSVFAYTSGGNIHITKTYSVSYDDHSINLKTSGGDIRLILPDNFPCTFDALIKDADTRNAIDSEFPITIVKKHDDVRGTGTVGEGTYLIKLRTSRGQIIIEKD